MAARFHILGACLALAAMLLAGPVAHLGHTHDAHGHCAAHAGRSGDAGHHCDHHHRHDAASEENEHESPASGQHDTPSDGHDCLVCQALAMPALAASFAASECSSEFVWRHRPLAITVTPQAVLLAYQQRGPPAA